VLVLSILERRVMTGTRHRSELFRDGSNLHKSDQDWERFQIATNRGETARGATMRHRVSRSARKGPVEQVLDGAEISRVEPMRRRSREKF
jgi:hypothetical protein